MPDAKTTALGTRAWARALELTAPITARSSVTLPRVIEDLAERFGAAPALLSEDESFTYRELAERARRYARWASGQGLARGDAVALIMPNRPEYLAIWLGLTRAGCVAALINTNISGDALAHALRIASPRQVIVAAELSRSLADILPRLGAPIRCWVHGAAGQDFPRIDEAVEREPAEPLSGEELAFPAILDRALCIYTSGTTGLPKAANVSHLRLMHWSHWFAGMMDVRPDDRMYNCLPMYHSIGGVVATASVLIKGGSVVIRPKFSASRFWDEVLEWDCTLFQYIGELCRYLAASPPHPRERAHRLRLCCGNGLTGEVWTAFAQRFGISQILEFYAATEGSFSLYNCEGRPGAIGRIPGFLAHRFPVALVRHDVATGEPMRDDKGFCTPCGADEVGEAIGRIDVDAGHSHGRYEGYTDAAASAKKVLRDVFAPGDAWFRTGDLMRRDAQGFFYFVDRVGDSFRWKGENVSTAEVANAVGACSGVTAAVVYGVSIPGAEGRAGMAAIAVTHGFDLARFHGEIATRLPDYARPLFLRLCGAIEATATFKPRKQVLAADGYDPALIDDPLYFDDRQRRAYVRIDAALHRRISAFGERAGIADPMPSGGVSGIDGQDRAGDVPRALA